MRPNRRGLLFAVGLGIALVLALWLGRGGCAGDPPDQEAPRARAPPEDAHSSASDAPLLTGRARAEPAAIRARTGPTADAAPHALHGRVLAPDGEPIPEALVYLLPQDLPGVHATRQVPHALTDADGAFRLPPQAPRAARWLCVRHDEFLPAHLDASSIPTEEPLEVVLEPGALVHVRFEGEAGASPPLGTGVRVDPVVEEGEPWEFAGPSAEGYANAGGSMDRRSEATFRIGTRAPLRVTAWRHGHVPEPAEVILPPGGGEAVFRFLPSCVLEVLARAAESGEPITTGVSVRLSGPGGTGEHPIGGTTQRNDEGVVRVEHGVYPGRYAARVWTTDRRAVVLDDVHFTHHGERQTRTVYLERDEAPLLVLRWAPPEEPPSRRALTLFWRSRQEDPPRWRHALHVEEASQGGGTAAGPPDWRVRGVGPGVVDLLAIDGRHHEEAAFVEGLILHADGPTEVLLPWRRAMRVDLSRVLEADALVRTIELRGPPIGRLPLVAIGQPTMQSWDDPHAPGDAPGGGWILGPYPVDRVVVDAHLHGEARPRRFEVPASSSAPTPQR